MNILFIGTGHMSGAILKAVKNNYNNDKNIYILNRTLEKSKQLSRDYNCNYIEKLEEIKNLDIDIFILGVRPIECEQLLKQLDKLDISNKLIISMINSYSINQINSNLNTSKQVSIIRIMPNMNAINSQSTTGYCVDNKNKILIKKGLEILQAFGSIYELEEQQFSAFTAATGCSPAYIFNFIKAFIDFCTEQGFDYNLAKQFISEVIINTAQNFKENDNKLEDLIDQICVPNGSTIEGQNVLNNKGFVDILIECLNAAKNKS